MRKVRDDIVMPVILGFLCDYPRSGPNFVFQMKALLGTGVFNSDGVCRLDC